MARQKHHVDTRNIAAKLLGIALATPGKTDPTAIRLATRCTVHQAATVAFLRLVLHPFVYAAWEAEEITLDETYRLAKLDAYTENDATNQLVIARERHVCIARRASDRPALAVVDGGG